MAEVNLKGASLKSSIKFLTEKFGPEKYAAILAAMPVEDQLVIRNVLPHHWVPARSMVNLMHAAAKATGQDAKKLAFELGQYSAEDGLTTLYRLFFKVGSPEFIIGRAAKVWRNFYDVSDVTLHHVVSGHLNFRVNGMPIKDEILCERIRGWLFKATVMMGYKPEIVQEKCTAKGDEYCEFAIDWKK
jgi:predicted hydrocarbon binding protein